MALETDCRLFVEAEKASEMAIDTCVLEQKDYIVGMRRYFHAHPEVSLKEFKTSARIEEELDKVGIEHTRVGETGVYARVVGKKPVEGKAKIVALRADMDALGMDDLKNCEYSSQNPGFCHACGHDGHTATLLAAARILKSMENDFAGEVRFFFQQAEEIGQGARQFVAAGLLEGVDRIYGQHVTNTLNVGQVGIVAGPLNASCDFFRIEVKGKGAHVSMPHKGVDALYVASQIVVAVQSIVARSTDPMESAVVGIGKAWAGTQYNIVAEEAVLEGTVRTFLPEVREATNRRLTDIVEKTAEMLGAKASIIIKNYSNPLINDADATKEAKLVAQEIVGAENIITDYPKSMMAEDFADYLPHCKGTFVYFGTHSDKPGTDRPNHNGFFDIDEDGLLVAYNMFVRYALHVLGTK